MAQDSATPQYVVVAIPGEQNTKTIINETLNKHMGVIPADTLGALERMIVNRVHFSTLIRINGDYEGLQKVERYRGMNLPMLELKSNEFHPVAPEEDAYYSDYFYYFIPELFEPSRAQNEVQKPI